MVKDLGNKAGTPRLGSFLPPDGFEEIITRKSACSRVIVALTKPVG